MPQFLAALMALISTFSQGGQPTTLPPVPQDVVSQRGSEISDLAKSLHLNNSGNETENTTGNETVNSQNNFGFLVSDQTPDLPKLNGRAFGNWVSSQANSQNQSQNQTQNATGNESSNNSSGPDTNHVGTNNINSGFQMPTNLPQIALDRSHALEPVDPFGTPFPLPPGRRN